MRRSAPATRTTSTASSTAASSATVSSASPRSPSSLPRSSRRPSWPCLQDSPILDESDYNEREWEAFEEALKEAVEQAQREYTLVDTVVDDEAIAQLWYEDEGNAHRQSWCRADDVDWEVVAEEYREARDAYFTERATEVYRWHVLGYNPDQLELFAA
jgi:hypothetical protein